METEHARLLSAAICPEKPFSITVEEKSSNVFLEIIGYDYSQLFSIICGVLATSGLEIQEGRFKTIETSKGNLIVNHLTGTLSRNIDLSLWKREITEDMNKFYELLMNGRPRDLIQRRLIEHVIPSIPALPQQENMLNSVNISVKQLPTTTRIKIESLDSSFFLFNLGVVLNLHYLKIGYVSIKTKEGRLIDTIEITNEEGQPIINEESLNRIKLSILITKQFTFFLDRSPDPGKAIFRFGSLILNQLSSKGDLLNLLSSSRFHSELGRLLGTSDFLWEDFIRIQQDSIFPMLKKRRDVLSHKPEDVELALATEISKVGTDMQAEVLNRFKNRESFLIDIDHIMKDRDFFFLSHRLSALADAVIRQACAISWRVVTEKYGQPRTAAGLVAQWTVFGMGKLGGQALGYASDLELLFVFSDNGTTDGKHSISNRDFFERFFKMTAGLIGAKKKGIFQVDLRLRPYGIDGPLAVKLDAFNDYFRAGGRAHSSERLALVRLRQIGGDNELGRECLVLRDHILYESDAINIPELRELRSIQLKQKTRNNSINMKFSPGGLVDLEYNVQILQIIHGRKHEKLRVPGIHMVLQTLNELGAIDQAEASSMIDAYRFHRNIINGLRMLRGNAEDLFLPSPGDREFRHLARRVGYKKQKGLSETEQLIIDFETTCAKIKHFVEQHLGNDAIPARRRLNIVDVLLSNDTRENLSDQTWDFLISAGFKKPLSAFVNLKHIAEYGAESFIPLIILAWNRISQNADPDMTLNNWEQFISRLEKPVEHFIQLLSMPMRMDILFKLFARSQFLADILIQNPVFFLWITDSNIVSRPRTQIEMENALDTESSQSNSQEQWRNRLRVQRKKEILRIGLRDIALGVKIEEIMGELSFLARSCVEVALRRITTQEGIESNNIAVLAFGKLGGWELNYSSDIDLLFVYHPHPEMSNDQELRIYTKIFQRLVRDLTEFTQEGQAYRVDMRLRPYGASGPLVSSLPSIMEYYKNAASSWEFQTLIKLKPIAGNLILGEELLRNILEDFHRTWQHHDPRISVASMRQKSIDHHIGRSLGSTSLSKSAGLSESTQTKNSAASPQNIASQSDIQGIDIKNDHGGIRDIEFFLQGQQMLHYRNKPFILTGNTLRGLRLLKGEQIISQKTYQVLGEYYCFFRRVEHYLQLVDNKQLHSLPNNKPMLNKLITCLHHDWTNEQFVRYFRTALREVHEIYTCFING